MGNGDNLKPDKFVPIDILSFRRTTRDITFNVYIKLSDNNIAMLFSKTTGLDYKRLAQYVQKGVKQLHIHPDDLPAYKDFISHSAESIFNDPTTPQEKKIATLLNMTEQNMAELFSQFNIEGETADATQRLVKSYVDIMTRDPQSLTMILRLVSHGEYLYYHSIAVSIFAMLAARVSGQFDQRTIEIIGFGGFLHDIGSTQLPKEVICSPTELTPDQWKEMRTHPKLGLKMIEWTPGIPDEVRYIVYQHHEEPSGHGYPNGIRGNSIYYPAKFVAAADAFSALISKRPFRPAYSVEEAIRILKESPGKYDSGVVKIFASISLQNAHNNAA